MKIFVRFLIIVIFVTVFIGIIIYARGYRPDFKAKSLILGGGVSANQELRKQFKNKLEKERFDTQFFVPEPSLSTDNAIMTAITGFYHQKETKPWQGITAEGNLRISK